MFIGKRSNGYYFVEYFDETLGIKKRISTGTKIKKDALKFLSEFDSQLKKAPKIQVLSLSAFQKEYSEFVKNTYSKKYLESVELSFRKLIEFSKDIPLNQINVRLCQQFISTTSKRTVKGAELYHRTLKAALSRAVLWGYLVENPLKKVKLARSKKSYPLFITEIELQKILDKTSNLELKNLYILAFNTGMRLGEIVNLKWNAIDLQGKTIIVKNDKTFLTKSKKDRIVPLNDKLVENLNNRYPKVMSLNRNEYVFHMTTGVRFNNDYVSKSFKNAVNEAELDDKIHFHTLRHSFASNLVQRGASLYVVKELLGHEDITTTQIYSHLQKENLVNAVNLLN